MRQVFTFTGSLSPRLSLLAAAVMAAAILAAPSALAFGPSSFGGLVQDPPALAAPTAEPTPEETLARDNAGFALSLYGELKATKTNLFFSPYSISTALAMTYAGARENTKVQMARTLMFSQDGEALHTSFAAIESRFSGIQKAGSVILGVANSLWPQKGYDFKEDYVSLIKRHYGVTVTHVDYARACEEARKTINGWVELKTQDKIKELLKPGILDEMTRLVLVNAIYFKGSWECKFEKSLTRQGAFRVSPDKTVQAELMMNEGDFGYADTGSAQVLELPYEGGDLSMLVLLPREAVGTGGLEQGLTCKSLEDLRSQMRRQEVVVYLPKFKMTSSFRLDGALTSMGMVDAFSEKDANFSGMDGRPGELYIGAVIHKAFVDVNEEGTEAAAATAVVMQGKGFHEPPPIFRADRPFLFLIQERKTGSVLFMGRVCDPTDVGE